MSRLVKQVERLMFQEECVVVPRIGGFIKHTRSAYEDEAKGLLYPGREEISFNALLDQNDGLLVQAYSKAYSFGYKRALALMEQDVNEALSQLEDRGVWQVGSIGRITKERATGQFIFLPNPDHPFSIDYYGLMPVATLPSLSRATTLAPIASTKKDTIYLPINLHYVRYATTVAVIAGTLFLIPLQRLSLTSQSASPSEYQAGFLSHTEQEGLPVANAPTVIDLPIAEEESASILSEVVTEASAELMGFPLCQAPVGSESYYIVISTLSTEAAVKKFIAENRDYVTFDHTGILRSSSGVYRIFADRFASKEDAQLGLNELTKDPQYASAWIYRSM